MKIITLLKRKITGRHESLSRERAERIKRLPKDQARRELGGVLFDLGVKHATEFVKDELQRSDPPFKGVPPEAVFHEILALTFWIMDKEIAGGKKTLAAELHGHYLRSIKNVAGSSEEPHRERSLWSRGIESWKEFLSEDRIPGISEGSKSRMDCELIQANESLRMKDSLYFASRVPNREMWRCLGDFRDSVAFLDIETTGMSFMSPITVVGVFDGSRMHTLVRGQNLTRGNLEGILSGASMMVTFNGSGFDLPMIEAQFPGVVPRVPHVDLRHSLRRLGLTGGLKRIERELEIERDRRVEYMTGEDAVYLCRLWERQGKKNALDLLIEYNAEDCRNLKVLANHAYKNLRGRVFEAVRRPGKIE